MSSGSLVFGLFMLVPFFLKKKKALNYVVAIGSQLMMDLIQVQG